MNIPQSYYPLYTTLQGQYMMPQYTQVKMEEPEEIVEEVQQSSNELFNVNIRPEIRKGCIWEVQFKLTETLLKDHPITKMNMIVAALEKVKHQMKNGEYYLVLKIRSKLIEPVKEVPFLKVAELANNMMRIDVINGVAVLRVKFIARPRNIFHKHADVMILVAELYSGNEVITEDCQELIFRGGTGSAHSAENRKLSVLKKSNPPTPQLNNNNYAMHYTSQVMYPYTMPQQQMVHNQQPISQTSPSQSIRAEALTVPELDDFDADNFFSDFMNNKGDTLAQYEPPQQEVNTMSTFPNDSPGFSFNVTGFQIQPNGLFQGSIEGVYLNKAFRGSFQTSITDTNIQGSFNATFDQQTHQL